MNGWMSDNDSIPQGWIYLGNDKERYVIGQPGYYNMLIFGVNPSTATPGDNNIDPAMAAMLYDLHAYKTGSYDDHAHLGAELARKFLKKLELTNEAETEQICSAIYHHDDKLTVDNPMDEVLKDADVIHHCMNDLSKQVKEKEQARFEKLCNEFGM